MESRDKADHVLFVSCFVSKDAYKTRFWQIALFGAKSGSERVWPATPRKCEQIARDLHWREPEAPRLAELMSPIIQSKSVCKFITY